MKARITFVVIFCCLAGAALAQQGVLDGVYVKETTLQRAALPYTYLREADVMWSKRIWRVIDLKEKINLPFAYPLSKTVRDRRSLIDVVMDAAETGELTLYNQTDDEFTVPLTSEDMKKLGGAGVDTVHLTRPDPPYDPYDSVISRVFSRDKVIAYRIKEDWFFDKQRSVIEARIIGFAPLIYAVDEYGNIREGNIKVPLFWVYYNEARQMLANAEVFNRTNDAERRSFDDLFQKRMFNSYVMKESNVYDRRIDDYAQGLNALLESERVKTEITNMEHDLWEY